MKSFKQSDYLYTSQFCEENIWQLTRSLINEGHPKKAIHILFISNNLQKIALLNQRAAPQDDIIIWDYHVILLVNTENSHYIFDFDTRLAFPTHIDLYFQRSIPSEIEGEYLAEFRLIPATDYLKYFYSDRSHMKNIIPDTLFPGYPAILSKESNRMFLKDLFNLKKKIDNTFIFHNHNQISNWLNGNKI